MKRVMITGATSGMGLSATKLFLERGWKVLMVDLNAEKGESLVKELSDKKQQNIFFCKCDVSSEEEMKALYEYARTHLGGIDSVINNAGIFVKGPVHEVSEQDWDKVFAIDVKSVFLSAKYFVPYMMENGGGTIVNTVSVSGMFGDYNMAGYNAAKGAVINLARSMALDYGAYNIRVNNVCPSACQTPMFLQNPQSVIDEFCEASPLKRICKPEEVAKAMYFLASDESSFCTGINLPVSGGMEIWTRQPVQK